MDFPNRKVLLISSSRMHGMNYLENAQTEIINLLKKNRVANILFVPYAQKDHNSYMEIVRVPFNSWGFNISGIHEVDPLVAAERAEAFFIGGGNTFLLLKTLYDLQLVDIIRKRVLEDGVPYIGSSAGTNVATRSIQTTNDMPIVYPPTFNALNLVPFNINPHYLDVDALSTHKGETRDERIFEYLEDPEAAPVVGLREGCSLLIEGNNIILKGKCRSKIFIPGQQPYEVEPEANLNFLLTGQERQEMLEK